MVKKLSVIFVFIIVASLMLTGCGLLDFLGAGAGGGGGSTPPKTEETIEKEEIEKAVAIGTAQELLSYSGSSVKLTADIVLDGEKITPLKFTYFFGENFTIRNATIEAPTTSSYKAGLFHSDVKLVKDLKLENLNVSGSDNVGGIVSSLTGKIENCEIISGNVTATIGDGVGGFAGTISGKDGMITNCKNGANVTGTSSVGGIAGIVKINSAPKMEYKQLENSGDIVGKEKVGGIFGDVLGLKTNMDGFEYFTSRILECTNSGSVSADAKYAGGIVAYMAGETKSGLARYIHYVEVADCFNTGSVASNDIVSGGILGYGNQYSSITTCENSGSVEGLAIVGGIVGESDGKVVNCKSTKSASVSATGQFVSKTVFPKLSSAFLGGIGGVLQNIENCENQGSVTYESNADFVGGVVGVILKSASNCVNSGTVYSNGNSVGGIAGGAYFSKLSAKLESLENSGSVTAQGNMVGGLVGQVLATQGSAIGEGSYNSSIHGINKGEIEGVNYVGGLVGKAVGEANMNRKHKIAITGSNSADITATNGVKGDIVGEQK